MGGNLPLYITPYVSSGDDFGAGDGYAGPSSPPSLLSSSWNEIHNWFNGTRGTSLSATAEQGRVVRDAGLVTSIMGAVSSAIGSFYAAKTAQYQERSQASSLAFQSDMASINASRAEITAQSIEEAGKNRISDYTMAAGEQKAGAVASMAARGIALGSGSAADVAASMDIQKDLNVHAINADTTRQAWAAREQATNYGNQSLLARTGAVNANRSASSISPGSAMFSSLLTSATRVASGWDYNRWLGMRLAQGSPIPQMGIGG